MSPAMMRVGERQGISPPSNSLRPDETQLDHEVIHVLRVLRSFFARAVVPVIPRTLHGARRGTALVVA